jgi:hypothetical protein
MPAMKTLPAVTFVAAIAAFLLLPLSFEVATSLVFATGFGAIAFSDYSRPLQLRPLTVSAPNAAAVAAPRTERFGLAA